MQTPDVNRIDLSRLAQDLQIRKSQVESVVQLLDEGNTIPFITRYRKERTGGLDEEALRVIQERVVALRQLADRKGTILKTIESQGKLTDELRDAILAAETPKRLEDLYLPYKPKKRSLATAARERGLEPLALAILQRDPAVDNLAEFATTVINPEKELPTAEAVLEGAGHILAELIGETADVRHAVRVLLWDSAKISTRKSEKIGEHQGLEYKDYFEFAETIRHIPPHRILALNRGEKENALAIRLDFDPEAVKQAAFGKLPLGDHPHAEFLRAVTVDALQRLVLPSLEREIRRELTDVAQEHAVGVFARNLRSLLLAPPLRGRRVLGIDPGFRTGCKVAALDEHGKLLEDGVIFPHTSGKEKGKRGKDKEKPKAEAAPAAPTPAEGAVSPPAEPAASPPAEPAAAPSVEGVAPPPAESAAPPVTEPAPETPPAVDTAAPPAAEEKKEPPAPLPLSKRREAKARLETLLRRHGIQVIALGNGTGCRETEELVSEVLADLEQRRTAGAPAEGVDPSLPEAAPDLAYVIVNEAGASVYSASPVGREEFPNADATLRGTVSIGRRLQDPLSELVKIDPQHIGVGLYQHDVQVKELKESLDKVVESCVNHIGVDLNTASVPLLRHVSGLNQLAARELVDYRNQHGPYRNREHLLQVPSIGPARYTQAAGFLKILDGDNPFDRTWIHPESYPAALKLLEELNFPPAALLDRQAVDGLREQLKTLQVDATAERLQVGKPTLVDILEALGRPGRDPREDLPPPLFKKGILKLEDLQAGMELQGTVLNVVDFGAFVDVGLKDSGLVHISQMANRYIRSPHEVISVGDVVTVWVLTVDKDRRRVSLTMMKPGGQRKPPERRSGPPPLRPQQPQQPQQQHGGPPRHGQSQGPPREPRRDQHQQQQQPPRGGPPPRGRRPGGPPPRPQRPPQPRPTEGSAGAAPPPPQKPRRPGRPTPPPKLTQAALQGKTPLRTFSELNAFFAAKTPPPPVPAEEAPPPPPAEAPPTATAAPEVPPPTPPIAEGGEGGA